MDEMLVRRASMDDLDAIGEISRLTWDGDDYLEAKASRWIRDGTLRVGELDGRVLGTFRISPMPCGVLWLEALRVHAAERGRGLGRQLADEAFRTGKRMIREGQGDCMEFSTYVNNHESIHICTDQGFRVVNRFMLMRKEGIGPLRKAVACTPAAEDFRNIPGHIPCGWKYPVVSPEGVRWALGRCGAYRCGDAVFLRKKGSDETTPVTGSRRSPGDFLDGAEAVAASMGDGHSCLVVHESRRDIIELAFSRGYDTWEPVEGFNVLVFRYGELPGAVWQ